MQGPSNCGGVSARKDRELKIAYTMAPGLGDIAFLGRWKRSGSARLLTAIRLATLILLSKIMSSAMPFRPWQPAHSIAPHRFSSRQASIRDLQRSRLSGTQVLPFRRRRSFGNGSILKPLQLGVLCPIGRRLRQRQCGQNSFRVSHRTKTVLGLTVDTGRMWRGLQLHHHQVHPSRFITGTVSLGFSPPTAPLSAIYRPR